MRKIRSSEITPEHLYLTRPPQGMRTSASAGVLSRRAFVAGAAALVASAAACRVDDTRAVDAAAAPQQPADTPTPFEAVTGYNNFYEFSTDKEEVARLAKGFRTAPWTVAVGGLVQKPKTYGIEDLRKFTQEERVYRLRCVEGW